jgi:hypothetical protein
MYSKLFYSIVMVLLLILLTVRGSCNAPESAIEASVKAGFSEVNVLQHHYLFVALQGCSNSDAAKFDMIGKNPSGKAVHFSVCQGFLFKDSTIRF